MPDLNFALVDTGEASVWTALLPPIMVVLIAFVVIGMALPVLPLHVPEGLGFGTAIACLVLGVSGPVLGLVASGNGINAAFLISAVAVLLAFPGSLWLLHGPTRVSPRRAR